MRIMLILLNLMFFSCTSTFLIKMNYPGIDVFTNDKSIPYKYKEVDLIVVDDNGFPLNENSALNEAIKQANQIRADGLLILQSEIRHEGFLPFLFIGPRTKYRYSAIVKAEEPLSTPPKVERQQ
jgi:hypothetical protein